MSFADTYLKWQIHSDARRLALFFPPRVVSHSLSLIVLCIWDYRFFVLFLGFAPNTESRWSYTHKTSNNTTTTRQKKCSSPEQIQCHQGIKSSIYVGLVNGSTGTHSAARTRIHTLAPWHRFIFHFGFIVGYINSKELYFANNILFCLSFFIIAIAAECTEPHKLCTE